MQAEGQGRRKHPMPRDLCGERSWRKRRWREGNAPMSLTWAMAPLRRTTSTGAMNAVHVAVTCAVAGEGSSAHTHRTHMHAHMSRFPRPALPNVACSLQAALVATPCTPLRAHTEVCEVRGAPHLAALKCGAARQSPRQLRRIRCSLPESSSEAIERRARKRTLFAPRAAALGVSGG